MTVESGQVSVHRKRRKRFGIRVHAKHFVPVSESTFLSRSRKLILSMSSSNIFLRSMPLTMIRLRAHGAFSTFGCGRVKMSKVKTRLLVFYRCFFRMSLPAFTGTFALTPYFFLFSIFFQSLSQKTGEPIIEP